MVNTKQLYAIGIAGIVAWQMFACPPYYDDGGLFGGNVYYLHRKPPSDPYISRDESLLHFELFYLSLALIGAIIALRSKATPRQEKVFWVGLALQVGIFASQVGQFNMILTIPLTWSALFLLSIVVLTLELVFWRDRSARIPSDAYRE